MNDTKNVILAFKDTVGFCIDLSDEWFYEGQIVDIVLNKENNNEIIKSALIKSVNEIEKIITLENYNEESRTFSISLEEIEKISLIERRKINRRKTERY